MSILLAISHPEFSCILSLMEGETCKERREVTSGHQGIKTLSPIARDEQN